MPDEPLDLWPADLGGEEADVPVLLLRSQAALLGAKPNNMVEARVSTQTGESLERRPPRPQPVKVPFFRHNFDLVVPALEQYTYRLFWISHGIDSYPVTWTLELNQGKLESREEFVDWLAETLGSERTKKIIRTLLAQAKS